MTDVRNKCSTLEDIIEKTISKNSNVKTEKHNRTKQNTQSRNQSIIARRQQLNPFQLRNSQPILKISNNPKHSLISLPQPHVNEISLSRSNIKEVIIHTVLCGICVYCFFCAAVILYLRSILSKTTQAMCVSFLGLLWQCPKLDWTFWVPIQ